MGRPGSRGLFFAAVLLSGACTVDGAFLDTELFECAGPSDCGSGWGCVRSTPYASDFCAPDCDDTCDGICVRQGDAELCLRGCRILDDGSTSECKGEGFACIRASAENDDGVCYPVEPCRSSEDCDAGEECLSDFAAAFGVSGALRTDNLYCIPAPTNPSQCPARSVHSDEVFRGSIPDLCIARCDAMDTRCPPGFGCLRQLAGMEETICLPGIYGVPCDDDTNCLLGRCIDTGAPGRFCTSSCTEAESAAFGCDRLSYAITVLGLRYHLECDPAANGGVDGGLCVPRYEVGFPCTTPESGVFTCAAGLGCQELSGSGGVRVCTKACTRDDECNGGDVEDRNYCNMFFSVCLPRQTAGEECLRPEQCQSGACELGSCT